MSCFLSPEPGLIYLYRIFSHFCLKQHIKSIIILDYLSVHQQIDQSRHCCSSARLLLCCNKRGSLHKLHSGGLLFDSTENLLLMCESVTSGHWHRRRRKTSALIQFWAAALKWSPERKKEEPVLYWSPPFAPLSLSDHRSKCNGWRSCNWHQSPG